MKFPITILISNEEFDRTFNRHGNIATSKEEAVLNVRLWYIYSDYFEQILLIRECDAQAAGLIPQPSEEIN